VPQRLQPQRRQYRQAKAGQQHEACRNLERDDRQQAGQRRVKRRSRADGQQQKEQPGQDEKERLATGAQHDGRRGQEPRQHAHVADLDAQPISPEGRAPTIEIGRKEAQQRPRRQGIVGATGVVELGAQRLTERSRGREQADRGQGHSHRAQQGQQRQCPTLARGHGLIERVAAQEDGREEGHLPMPCQRRHAQRRPTERRPAHSSQRPRGEDGPMNSQKGQGQPGGDGDQVQVADVGDEDVGQHERQRAEQRRRSAERNLRAQQTQTGVHGHPGQEEVPDDQRLDAAVTEAGPE